MGVDWKQSWVLIEDLGVMGAKLLKEGVLSCL